MNRGGQTDEYSDGLMGRNVGIQVGKGWQEDTVRYVPNIFHFHKYQKFFIIKSWGKHCYFYPKISLIVRSKDCKDSGNLKFLVNRSKETVVFKGLKLARKGPSIHMRWPCGCTVWPGATVPGSPSMHFICSYTISPLYRRTKLEHNQQEVFFPTSTSQPMHHPTQPSRPNASHNNQNIASLPTRWLLPATATRI